MDISTVIMMLLIGVFGGFISGLVGIGGAIIIYPTKEFLDNYILPLIHLILLL